MGLAHAETSIDCRRKDDEDHFLLGVGNGILCLECNSLTPVVLPPKLRILQHFIGIFEFLEALLCMLLGLL